MMNVFWNQRMFQNTQSIENINFDISWGLCMYEWLEIKNKWTNLKLHMYQECQTKSECEWGASETFSEPPLPSMPSGAYKIGNSIFRNNPGISKEVHLISETPCDGLVHFKKDSL